MDNVSLVKEKADIVDFIKGYVPLKQSGINFKGNCPFHKENTPSFMVNPDLQIYKCFGCGKSGDILSFAMEIEGLEFYDSLKLLADKYGVTLTQDKKLQEGQNKKSKIFEINDIAANFYSAVLLKHDAGKGALEYLRNRKTKTRTINEFKIGYAPNVWSSISKLLLKKGYTEKEIVEAGLAKFKKNGGIYDVFRDRVVFPFIAPTGKILGFAGRSLSKEVNPKYMNTPQTLVFHKDQFLYGIGTSKGEIRKDGVAVIAEGIFDMISPFQEGIKNIVASQGTALTSGQVKLIERYADSVVLLFDSDIAGITAALRGISIIEESYLEVKIAIMPKGFKDPDEVVCKDPGLLKKAIDDAMFIGDFYLYYTKKNFDLSNVYQKSKAVDFLLSKLARMSDEIVRGEYLKKYSTFLDIDENVLVSKLSTVNVDKEKVDFSEKGSLKKEIEEVTQNYPIGETYLISLLIKCSDDVFSKSIALIESKFFSDKSLSKIFDIIKEARLNRLNKDGETDENSKRLDFKVFYDKLRSVIDSEDLLNSFFLTEFENEISNDEFIISELLSSANRLRKNYSQRKLKFLSKEIRKAEIMSDFNKVSRLNEEFKKISKELS